METTKAEPQQNSKQGFKLFFSRLWNFFSILEDMSGVMILIFIVLLICLSIFMRIAFNYESSSWEELSRFLSLWMYLFGVAIASKENSHLRMGFLENKIKSARIKQGMEVVFNAISLTCMIIFAIWSLEYVQWSIMIQQKSLVMMIGMWVVHLSFVVGSSLAALHLLSHLLRSIYTFITGSRVKSVQAIDNNETR